MTDREAMIARHSVRAYQDKKIDEDTARQLKEYIGELNAEYDLHLQYMDNADGVFTGLANKLTGWTNVPAYIAVVGRRRDDLDEICGYAGEKLVLYAQKLGLNTCWAGFFKRRRCNADIGDNERLVISIAVGYGVDGGRARRSKKIEDVTDAADMPQWFKDGTEAALLAPTAVNQQKFFISLDGDKPTFRVSANGPFVKLDLGIVKCHFEIGSGKSVI